MNAQAKVDQVDYDHFSWPHTLAGPQLALSLMLSDHIPKSLLDVGCGTGTWLKAAMDLGVKDLLGIDGVEVPDDKLHIPKYLVRKHNLGVEWDLGRDFEVILCLEVAEHLAPSLADTLIDGLVKHGNTIYFSAACPGQKGQHHVNCQWPAYWQKMFNTRGFVCEDKLRWKLWDVEGIEHWYRQNVFIARRNPDLAGKEPRIAGVIHPGIFAATLDVTFPRVVSWLCSAAHPIRSMMRLMNRSG